MIPFAEDLNGVTAAEVGALLTYLRKPEHRVYSTSNGSKTVRRFKAAPLGIEINVTEVFFGKSCTDEMLGFSAMGGAMMGSSTFTVETVEWEFKVKTTHKFEAESDENRDETIEASRIGTRDCYLWLLDFDGCRDTYKHEMSMIRLAIGMFADT